MIGEREFSPCPIHHHLNTTIAMEAHLCQLWKWHEAGFKAKGLTVLFLQV